MARILVIDDEPELRDVIRRVLERAGHEVRVAADGEAGVVLHRKSPADLVITDIYMPGQDGLETLRALRQEGDVKVIVVSGGDRTGMASLREHAELLGARQALAKPFEMHELVALVEQVLREP